VNEAILLLIIYFLPLYTDFVPNSVNRFTYGWIVCNLIGGLLLANIAITIRVVYKAYKETKKRNMLKEGKLKAK
jgi:uncharacterized membrane protein